MKTVLQNITNTLLRKSQYDQKYRFPAKEWKRFAEFSKLFQTEARCILKVKNAFQN